MKVVIDRCPGGSALLSIDATLRLRELGGNHGGGDLSDSPQRRTDPLIVQMVEELGAEASGPYTQFEIVEIPDDVKWEIEWTDTGEEIHEIGRVWK